MAKRKLYPVEVMFLKQDIENMKRQKDWLTDKFINDCDVINENIKRAESILEAGEVEEEVFDGC